MLNNIIRSLEMFKFNLNFKVRIFNLKQDGATVHTANSTLCLLNDIFQSRIISKGIWPPRSPALNVVDFYLWGVVKQKVYQNKPQTLPELRNNIRHHIAAIQQEEIR